MYFILGVGTHIETTFIFNWVETEAYQDIEFWVLSSHYPQWSKEVLLEVGALLLMLTLLRASEPLSTCEYCTPKTSRVRFSPILNLLCIFRTLSWGSSRCFGSLLQEPPDQQAHPHPVHIVVENIILFQLHFQLAFVCFKWSPSQQGHPQWIPHPVKSNPPDPCFQFDFHRVSNSVSTGIHALYVCDLLLSGYYTFKTSCFAQQMSPWIKGLL